MPRHGAVLNNSPIITGGNERVVSSCSFCPKIQLQVQHKVKPAGRKKELQQASTLLCNQRTAVLRHEHEKKYTQETAAEDKGLVDGDCSVPQEVLVTADYCRCDAAQR